MFHLSIAELTGSSPRRRCADARMRLPVRHPGAAAQQHSAAQHEAIVEAILAGDAGRARTVVAEHLEGAGALLRGFLG